MGAVNTSYATPGVTFTSLNSQATATGPGPQGTLCLIGTAPQGSNQPKLFTNLQQAVSEYGTSVQAGSTFNLEPGLEICFGQSGQFSQLQVYCIRVGATQAAASVPQKVGGGTAYAFQAQPEYAGRNNLTVVVGTSTYFSSTGQFIQSVAVYDNTPGSNLIQENYSGPNPTNITQQINSQSVLVNVTTAGGAVTSTDNNMGQAGTYTLVGAVNGQNAADSDYANAINLAANINCDYIAALSGTPAVQAALFNHVVAMAALNKFREAFIGYPYTGQQEAQVVAQAVSGQASISSQYVCLLANTGGSRVNPVTNLQQIYDGFYWAAALAAKKAVNNPAQPLTRQSLNGLISLTETIPTADLITLGSYGIMALASVNNNIVLYDGLTLANWPSNYRKENIVSAQNRLSDILLAQVGSLIGSADPVSDISAIQTATLNALNYAVQNQIIVGYDIQSVAVVQTSPGIFTVTLRFFPRIEITQINFMLQLSLTIP